MKFSNILSAVIFAPLLALAHGEDKPGPHEGSIMMPGAFHTELVLGKDQSAHIYLLDINFQNATTKDSKINVMFRNKKETIAFKCSIMEDHYHCVPDKKYPNKGELIVQATRDNAVGNDAIYRLPLNHSKSEHSHH